MANKEIKQTIRLDGEKEYNAALKEANRNLRTLKSELKAETAELGKNATAQQKNEARSKSLQKQIKEQEEIVKTLRKALEEAKRDYGDNAEVIARWETKLNEARATLGNMRNDLEGLGQAYDGVNESTQMGIVATKSFADSVANIASVGDSVSSAIESIFSGMIDSVTDIVTDLWDLISETAAKADNYTDIAGYWNTDPAKIQMWSNALSASGKDLETFQQIVTRLNLGGKNKEITEMLGISNVNYEDQWAYAIAVMTRLSELQKAGNMPDNFWETIFGEKKSLKAMEIVNAWDSILDNLATYDADNGGFGLSSEGIEKYSQIYEEINKAQTSWDALKDSVAEGFADVSLNILANVNGGLEAINDILNAETEEEREEAVKKLEENVTELFQKVADAIRNGIEILGEVGEELSNSDDPVVAAIGKIMKDIAKALEWMVNHAEAVKAAFETVFGVWLVARLTSIAGKLTAIVAQINLIKGFNAGSVLAGADGAGSATGTAGAASAAGGGGIMGGLGLLALIAGGFKWAGDRRNNNDDLRGDAKYIEKQADDSVELQQAFIDYIEANQALQERLDAGLFDDEETGRLYEKVNAVTELLNSLEGHEGMLDAYSAWRQENGYGNMDWVLPDNMFGMTPGSIADNVLDTDMKNLNTTANQTTEAVNNLPAALYGIITKAIGGITLSVDGCTLGNVVLPYVSASIARSATTP